MLLNNKWVNNEIKEAIKRHLEKWKWEHNNPKSMGQSEDSPKREIHHITNSPQKKRKISNKKII